MDVWGQAISNGGGGNCNIALNIIRRDISIEASVKRKRHMAALDDSFRTTLIHGLI